MGVNSRKEGSLTISSFMYTIEGFMVGFIGRPALWLIKLLRWPILLAGFLLDGLSTYNPTAQITTSEHTYIPAIVGIILFAIGATIARYDEIQRDFYKDFPVD